MSVACGSTGTAHRLVLFTGCPTDSVFHTDSSSGSSGLGYDVRLKPEAATTPEQSEGKPSLDSRVVASLLVHRSANDDFGSFKVGTLKRQKSKVAGSFP